MVALQSLLHLLPPESSYVQSKQQLWVLLNIVVHLLLHILLGLIEEPSFLLRPISVALFSFCQLFLFLEHQIFLISVVLVKLNLLFRTQLLANVVPPDLSESGDP